MFNLLKIKDNSLLLLLGFLSSKCGIVENRVLGLGGAVNGMTVIRAMCVPKCFGPHPFLGANTLFEVRHPFFKGKRPFHYCSEGNQKLIASEYIRKRCELGLLLRTD